MDEKVIAESIERMQNEIDDLRATLELVVNQEEEMFQWIFAIKRSKRSIEEIVEQSVIEHFNITIRQFHGKHHVKRGVKAPNQEPDAVVEARKWFLSIVRRILLKSPYTLENHYPFYTNMIEVRHRPIFDGADQPKNEKDQQNRNIRLAIYKIIRRNCKNDGLFYEDFEDN